MVSESRGDTPTGRSSARPRIARAQTTDPSQEPRHPSSQFAATQPISTQKLSPPLSRSVVTPESARRWNIGRDVAAAVLLLVAPFFPWNLYFGGGIPGGRGGVFALLLAATALSLGSIAATYAGPRRLISPRFDPVLIGRLRAGLNAPYGLLVFGVVVFDVVQTVRYGGSANVPGGVGPGAWLGIAGSLLSAQPVITSAAADDGRFRGWLQSARVVGYGSITLAALSFSFNLFWRVKSALPGSTGSGFGKQNVAIIVTALIYGIVALVAVVVASRWILRRSRVSRLAIIALGASALLAGLIVWILPMGREIDGFHGIAQNTSTAGVGFEGYLAWTAAAAIFAPLILMTTMTVQQADIWRAAARKSLLLIVVWCVGSVVMRVTDLIVSVTLSLPYSPYDSAAMAAFDLVTAVLAIWLHINLLNRALPAVVITSACAVLLVLTIARIMVGIAFAPRYAGPSPASNAVYGNNLAQQITSTFDVVLCGLAVCILAIAVVTGRSRPTAKTTSPIRAAQPSPDPQTTRLAAGDPQTTRLATGGRAEPPSSPRIHRPPSDDTRHTSAAKPKIYRTQGDPREGGRHQA
ncbi:hypothetical protein JMUB5695_04110 [Mycobacterium heckeshornense]|uniref:DUF7937 domain-containing protein n=1 Tax=Mycobacterium heckeshornense TaxID=110505 RepID=UPI001AF55643|nr:hypothetical protein JMUB5695_04110 [Mycobacterium heckeshornense]